jgi:hypothetical protein
MLKKRDFTLSKDRKTTTINGVKNNLAVRRKTVKRQFVNARREKNALEHLITLPNQSESVHIVIGGQFEPCDLIPAIRRLSHPAVISRLDISTLGFNHDNVATIARGIDQAKIIMANVVCSKYFARLEKASFEFLRHEITTRGGRVNWGQTHAKLILLEMSDGRFFTVDGSANLRSCNSIEQINITQDKELLLFHRSWLEELLTANHEQKKEKLKAASIATGADAADNN